MNNPLSEDLPTFDLAPSKPSDHFSFFEHDQFVRKRLELIMAGYGEEEADRLAKPKPIDQAALMEAVAREQENRLR